MYRFTLHKSSGIALLLLVMMALLVACQPIQPESSTSTVPPAAGNEAASSETSGDEIPEEGRVITLWVGPQRQTCMGVVEMQCLQVKRTADGEWENFFGGIDGFFFVPGYNYELLVRETRVDPVPADASSLAYTLEQTVSRTPDFAGDPLPLIGTNWRLVSFGVEHMISFDPAAVEVTAQFAEAGPVSGRSGCNRYNGAWQYNADTLVIGDLATTRMMCGEAEMAVESAFLESFVGEHQFQINGNKLEIIYAAGELIFQGGE